MAYNTYLAPIFPCSIPLLSFSIWYMPGAKNLGQMDSTGISDLLNLLLSNLIWMTISHKKEKARFKTLQKFFTLCLSSAEKCLLSVFFALFW